MATPANAAGPEAGLARRLGPFDATMIVMGGIIGSGIFANPHEVARELPRPLPTAAGAIDLFAYGGWQTASFVSGELKDAQRDLPRGLLFGVGGVVLLYLGVNWVCVRVLGGPGLAQTPAPASAIMQLALGPIGARLIEAGIAISTLGFLSQSMLTAPRALDRTFFARVGRLDPRTRAPVFAIALQGAFAILLTTWGQYRQILDYTIAVDFLFFGLTASCLSVFRRRDDGRAAAEGFRVPGHPWTTGAFVAVCWLFVANLVAQRPKDTLLGMAVLATGLPAYAFWRARGQRRW